MPRPHRATPIGCRPNGATERRSRPIMFDIGATELLVIVVVAILVIGPKDLPAALRAAGRWIGKFRRMSAHFRSGLDTMVREAEMEEMNREWGERNAAIMAAHPSDEMRPIEPSVERPLDGPADRTGSDTDDGSGRRHPSPPTG